MKILSAREKGSSFANIVPEFTIGKIVKPLRALPSRQKNEDDAPPQFKIFHLLPGKVNHRSEEKSSGRKVWTSKEKIPVNGWAPQGDGKCNRNYAAAFRSRKDEMFRFVSDSH